MAERKFVSAAAQFMALDYLKRKYYKWPSTITFFNQVQWYTTFVEVAATCRRLCFKHFHNGQDNDGIFNPVVPKHNPTQHHKWKKECINTCQTPNVVYSNYILLPMPVAITQLVDGVLLPGLFRPAIKLFMEKLTSSPTYTE